MLYKPGTLFNFEGVMLDSYLAKDEEVEALEKEGWGSAWDFVGDKGKSLPDGGQYEVELREKIKALGGKPAGRSSISTLESQLEKLQADADGNESTAD